NELPELCTAAERTETNFPVQDIVANPPQALAAGSGFMLTQALMGFHAGAPRHKHYVGQALPYSPPGMPVRGLRIGKHKLDIRFWTEANETAFEVIKGDPKLVERCDIGSKAAQLLQILQ